MRLHKQNGSAELPYANGYMSIYQQFLVVKSNLLSILTPAKVVKIFESQNIFPKNSNSLQFIQRWLKTMFYIYNIWFSCPKVRSKVRMWQFFGC